MTRLASTASRSQGTTQDANTRLDYSLELQVLESELPMCCRPSNLVHLVLATPKQTCLIRVHDQQAKNKPGDRCCRLLHVEGDSGSIMRMSPDQCCKGVPLQVCPTQGHQDQMHFVDMHACQAANVDDRRLAPNQRGKSCCARLCLCWLKFSYMMLFLVCCRECFFLVCSCQIRIELLLKSTTAFIVASAATCNAGPCKRCNDQSPSL